MEELADVGTFLPYNSFSPILLDDQMTLKLRNYAFAAIKQSQRFGVNNQYSITD
jgi:hypothetical protein